MVYCFGKTKAQTNDGKVNYMELVAKLPDKQGIIGTKEIAAAVNAGKIKRVIIASNCPDFLVEKIGNIRIDKFSGNQRELGTKLGKPFAVAMVGYDSA